MPRKKVAEADTSSFGPGMKWSDEARARRSEAAKKAAATRARKKADIVKAEARLARGWPEFHKHSRVARWALSGVSMVAMFRANPALTRG